jgi:peptidoglycan/LPS O-acetylase OafA/YrhL
MAALGPEAVATLVALHIPAAIIGILLWQWTRHDLPARKRVLLEAATLYFGLAVLLGIFLNYLLVAAMQDVIGPVMRGGAG